MQGISTAALASTLGTVGIILVAVIVVAILMGQRKGAKGAGSTSKNEIFKSVEFIWNILEKKDSKKPSRSGSISSAAAIAYVFDFSSTPN